MEPFTQTYDHLASISAVLIALAAALLLSACTGGGNAPSSDAAPAGARSSAAATSSATPAGPAAAMALPEGFDYPESDTLRVATWNVRHFVDRYDNPYIDAEREDDPPAGQPERVARFVEAVRRLDADVLVLQEFESAAFAERLAAERLPAMGYRFFAATESRDWYMNVVLMSRVPLGALRSYAGVTTPIEGHTNEAGDPAAQRFTNNRLWTVDVLARPGYTFTLAGLHLKAGRDARDVAWRTGQIRFLRRQLAGLLAARPQANVLVAGDLNALPGSPELRLLLEGKGGNANGSNANGRNASSSSTNGVRLIDPLAGQSALTHPAENPERQLDYLLVNENMRPELIDGSVRVASPLAPRAQATASDHLPVVATILAREQRALGHADSSAE